MSAATPNVMPVIEMKVLSEMVRVRRLARRYRSPTKISYGKVTTVSPVEVEEKE